MHLFTTTFTANSGLVEDAIVNTWHFEGSGADPENVFDMLEDFFTAVPAGESVALSTYFSNDAFQGECIVRGYDLDDPEPRAPMFTDSFTFSASSTASLPFDCAVVLSLTAEPVSGSPQARRRNRKYIGPLITSANQDGRVHPNFRDVLLGAARDMLAAANAAVSWNWRVYSPTNDEGYPLVGGWVDNEWDTQRRRGRVATERDLWTATTPTP